MITQPGAHLTAVPTLDAVADDPSKAAGRPGDARQHLLARWLLVGGVLISAPLATPVGAPTPEDEEWISQEQAEQMLNVSAKWFARRRGKLPFVKQLSPRKVVISKKGLLQWMSSRRTA